MMGLLSKVAERLAGSNYYSARAFYKHRLHQKRIGYSGSPLLIYQMGKVGSSSVKRSLETYSLDMPVYHVHYLSENRILELEKMRKKYFGSEIKTYQRPWLYQYLHSQIDTGDFKDKWKIITLVREPIARNISTFYENLDFEPIDSEGRYRVKSEYYGIEPMIIEQRHLKDLETLFFSRLDHEVPLKYFDQELKHVFGIDVLSEPFPTSTGYKIYSNQKAEVLLIRLESLDACAGEAFETFLHLKDFKIVNDNVGRRKTYARVYKSFKQNITIPGNYIDRLYNSAYMRHFYTINEIEAFREQWTHPG